MTWFSILKRSAPDIRNEAQYNAASLEERMSWHNSQKMGYHRRLAALQTQYTIDLTDVENPIYKEMKQYQDMRAFHSRQSNRIRRCLALGKTECNDYYSQELEGDNRRRMKRQTTPTGKRDPYVELSLEAYNNLTREQKIKYHDGIRHSGKDSDFHGRMSARLYKNTSHPTFPSPKYGGESLLGKEYTKEEYLNMDKKGKKSYHNTMSHRFKRAGNKELTKYHNTMYKRLVNNSSLPVYYSPEHEQEES